MTPGSPQLFGAQPELLDDGSSGRTPDLQRAPLISDARLMWGRHGPRSPLFETRPHGKGYGTVRTLLAHPSPRVPPRRQGQLQYPGTVWTHWLARRQKRMALAHRAVEGDLRAAAALLHGWSWAGTPAAVSELVRRARPADTPENRRLEDWALGPAGAPVKAASEAELDRLVLERVEGARCPTQEGALYWLARLGEEVRRREDRAWTTRTYAPDPRDGEVAALWTELLSGDFGPDTPRRFVQIFGGAVRRAVRGVCGALGLPRGIIDLRVSEAMEAADGLAWGAPGDIGARVLETSGEPLSVLAPALGESGVERVEGCVTRRRHWRGLRPLLQGALSEDTLPVGGDLVVASRLLVALECGTVTSHPVGLPGWGVVSANRGRLRGRLRAVLAEQPTALVAALRGLDALTSRTTDAVAWHAWAWAWREARSGFGFDPARLGAAPCPPPAPEEPALEPIGPQDEGAVLTLLLSLRGRGQWGALEAWLAGAGGRTLGPTFYRYLGQAPDCLADPGSTDRTHRGYRRLRDHLADGGLEAYREHLERVARRVLVVSRGRGLRARLDQALLPDWRVEAVPLPRRGVEAFCDNLVSLVCAY